jgi:MFS family permease
VRVHIVANSWVDREPQWCFLTFVLVFELGSLLCGTAQSSTMLIVGRAIAGIGGAGLMNGGFTILNSCVPIDRQPVLIGIMTARKSDPRPTVHIGDS